MQSTFFERARKAGAFTLEQLELKGFSRSIAEIQWLLVALVILYYVAPDAPIADRPVFIGTVVLYALTILAHRYSGLFRVETRWRLASETWLMVAFITWLMWQTGDNHSPLLNLYLLVLIMSGLTLGKTTTVLQLLLIVAIYIKTDYAAMGDALFSSSTFSDLMTTFAPFLLTTYLVTLLAADMQFSRTALQAVSETDELTGMPNRRAFQSILRREHERAVRDRRVFSVVMIDADGLKPTNDRYGHAAGDRLIREIAQAIRITLRASDSYARYGGDEFVALLPDTAAASALEAAERIRTGVGNTSFDHEGHRIMSTVSVGVATFPADARDPDELLAVADRALYRAKSGGKNKVVAPAPTEAPPPIIGGAGAEGLGAASASGR